MSPLLHQVLILAIVAIGIVLMLARPNDIPEVWWVGSGAVLLVVLRLIPLRIAGKAVTEGMDVYFFLLGMMLLSALGREHSVFDWVSAKATRGASGSRVRLFTLIYGIGIVTTVFLSNDATAVVLTPAVLSTVRKAKVPPMPHLFACAMIANAASFVLPISNPANLVVFRQNMPALGHWLAAFSIASLFSIVTTYGVLRFYFRAELSGRMQENIEAMPLKPAGKLVLFGLAGVVGVLLVTSALNKDLGLPTLIAALLITAVVSFKGRGSPMKLAEDLSWSTILLVAALFIMVAAVESLGVPDRTTSALHWATSLGTVAGATVISMTVGIVNNLVNNLPLGLLAGATVQAAHASGFVANAVLLGVDLGPNLSVTGSLATILWLLALRKESIDLSAWDFFKVGALAMPFAILASIGGILCSHLLFDS